MRGIDKSTCLIPTKTWLNIEYPYITQVNIAGHQVTQLHKLDQCIFKQIDFLSVNELVKVYIVNSAFIVFLPQVLPCQRSNRSFV